jgi:hypothetical protein
MKGIDGATLRRLIPAAAVTAVMALSLMAPSAVMGSTTNVAYGYGNNCGVKGYGTHDHGKLCPNRPFPGRGAGLSHVGDIDIPSSNEHQNLTTRGKSNATPGDETNATTLTTSGSTSEDNDGTPPATSRHHGKGHGKAHLKHG